MDLWRKNQNKFVEKHGIKLDMMSFFLKVNSITLQEFSSVNSMMESENMTTYDLCGHFGSDIIKDIFQPAGKCLSKTVNIERKSSAGCYTNTPSQPQFLNLFDMRRDNRNVRKRISGKSASLGRSIDTGTH